MTCEAGRRQREDFLPLNRREKKWAIPLTGSLIVVVNTIRAVCNEQDCPRRCIEMYTSLVYKITY
jgi:hypothetical protein